MRIGVDGRHVGEGRGVARTCLETLRALAVACPADELLVLTTATAPIAPNVRLVAPPRPERAAFGAGALLGRPALERMLGRGLDAVWLPAPAPLGLAGEAPVVLTVHDLSFVTRPQDFTPYERAWHAAGRLGRQARRAALVLAVSDATREQAIAHWGLDPGRVRTVRPGVWRGEPTAAVVTAPPAFEEEPYLLCVGALEPRKAPELAVGAHARARAAGLRAPLVFAGGGRLAARLEGRRGVHVAGAIADAQLDALMRGALAVVAPSWLEGYGMPPLEGLARGVPAIVADLPVYDETLGAGALRFAPGDADGLAQAMLRLERDADERARLVSAGQAAIAPLRWESTAQGVRAALAEVAR